jgi:hypothetical protein
MRSAAGEADPIEGLLSGLGKGCSRRFPFSVGQGPAVSTVHCGCCAGANGEEVVNMTSSENTHRRQRRPRFWRKLRSPGALRAIIKVAWIIYRAIRWLIEAFPPYG